jgi:predicted  nucleic acid-binding Zn-ribbon protein
MVSEIDDTVPNSPNAYTADMRTNFGAAKREIETLQDAISEVAAQVGRLKTLVVSLQQNVQQQRQRAADIPTDVLNQLTADVRYAPAGLAAEVQKLRETVAVLQRQRPVIDEVGRGMRTTLVEPVP